mmetsp:Transcript_82582/g.215169  ORF Transcript_82582/g.215169 Transcript_82582/m.215169 type:complete len:333 (+) Transcript_82582:184-1182(+)
MDWSCYQATSWQRKLPRTGRGRAGNCGRSLGEGRLLLPLCDHQSTKRLRRRPDAERHEGRCRHHQRHSTKADGEAHGRDAPTQQSRGNACGVPPKIHVVQKLRAMHVVVLVAPILVRIGPGLARSRAIVPYRAILVDAEVAITAMHSHTSSEAAEATQARWAPQARLIVEAHVAVTECFSRWPATDAAVPLHLVADDPMQVVPQLPILVVPMMPMMPMMPGGAGMRLRCRCWRSALDTAMIDVLHVTGFVLAVPSHVDDMLCRAAEVVQGHRGAARCILAATRSVPFRRADFGFAEVGIRSLDVHDVFPVELALGATHGATFACADGLHGVL